MIQATTHRPETIISMDTVNQHGVAAWRRFWIGVGIVGGFAVASGLLVSWLGGARAGVGYGLAILTFTLIAVMIDGAVLAHRRRTR